MSLLGLRLSILLLRRGLLLRLVVTEEVDLRRVGRMRTMAAI